ncbi:hypothetical protein B0T16DRAFT_108415 [Cercophora newfieldiana]|uniref:Uncharacterized protein n=1 Tax=Cercophora newfieldiana TaxID=92897 RepID=A0AA39YIJ1_9PEZI|nr:hypothetical protein B0T16DRAFT_108415 [Cercophora newfieldiana]
MTWLCVMWCAIAGRPAPLLCVIYLVLTSDRSRSAGFSPSTASLRRWRIHSLAKVSRKLSDNAWGNRKDICLQGREAIPRRGVVKRKVFFSS